MLLDRRLLPFVFVLGCAAPRGVARPVTPPPDYQAAFERALAADKLSDAERVLEEWRRAEPRSPEPHIGSAKLRLAGDRGGLVLDGPAGDSPLAEVRDGGGDVVGTLGLAGSDPARLEQAARDLERAQVLAPRRLDIYLGRAAVLERAGRSAELVAVLRALLARLAQEELYDAKARPLDAAARAELPVTLHHYTKGLLERPADLANAARLAEEITRAFPAHPYAHNDLAAARLRQDRPAEAIAALERGLAAAPDDEIVRFNLATLLADHGREKDACPHLRRLATTAQQPDDRAEAAQLAAKLTCP
jgi:tetratricopeptide (TPR) repeat protein